MCSREHLRGRWLLAAAWLGNARVEGPGLEAGGHARAPSCHTRAVHLKPSCPHSSHHTHTTPNSRPSNTVNPHCVTPQPPHFLHLAPPCPRILARQLLFQPQPHLLQRFPPQDPSDTTAAAAIALSFRRRLDAVLPAARVEAPGATGGQGAAGWATMDLGAGAQEAADA